jgi:hypothetical protein
MLATHAVSRPTSPQFMPSSRFLQSDRSAASIGLNLNVAAPLIQHLHRNHLNALRDYYVANGDEAAICARHGLSLSDFQDLRRQLRSSFTGKLDRKPVGATSRATVITASN